MVIPTRNRAGHLERLLKAIERQHVRPDEVIVVDASDDAEATSTVAARFPELDVTVEPHPPSVCAQRNRGVEMATGAWVLLCDDDIEPPPDYLGRLLEFAAAHPDRGAVTGLVRHDGAEAGPSGLRVPSVRQLLVAFVGQRGLWGDVESMPHRVGLAPLRAWYRERGNRWSLAGWPLMTQIEGRVIRTSIYHLGAALVRRDWLVSSPYDIRLDDRGSGDHYGVAIGFPGDRPITVLVDLPVRHHHAMENRGSEADSVYRGSLALQRFMRLSPRFSRWNELWLVWSLIVGAILGLLRGRVRPAWLAGRAALLVATGRNPLLRDSREVTSSG